MYECDGSEIFLEPDEVWGYFKENEDRLLAEDEWEIIAMNELYGVSIEMSPSSNGGVCITVSEDGQIVEDEFVYSESECTYAVERMYKYYLYCCDPDEEEYEDEDVPIEDKIKDREDELIGAAEDYLWTVTDNPKDIINRELLDDINEHFLEYLARKWNINIRRPMILEDEDGNDFYTDFPYKQMVFEDEDNPIYKK